MSQILSEPMRTWTPAASRSKTLAIELKVGDVISRIWRMLMAAEGQQITPTLRSTERFEQLLKARLRISRRRNHVNEPDHRFVLRRRGAHSDVLHGLDDAFRTVFQWEVLLVGVNVDWLVCFHAEQKDPSAELIEADMVWIVDPVIPLGQTAEKIGALRGSLE